MQAYSNLVHSGIQIWMKKEHNIFETIEIPLAHVLANMEFNGVTVDVEYLKTLTTLLIKIIKT